MQCSSSAVSVCFLYHLNMNMKVKNSKDAKSFKHSLYNQGENKPIELESQLGQVTSASTERHGESDALFEHTAIVGNTRARKKKKERVYVKEYKSLSRFGKVFSVLKNNISINLTRH